MKNNYYCLVTGLPELHLDDYKEPYRVKEFVSELSEGLIDRDFGYVRDILCLYDNKPIVDAVLGLDSPKAKEWQEKLQDHELVADDYIASFLTEVKRKKREDVIFSREELERMLFSGFYSKMTVHENQFIRCYFEFDLTLRNTLAVLNKRRFNLEKVNLVEAEDDSYIINQLKISNAGDFGLSGEIDYIQALIESFNNNDAVHSEKYIDQLRWGKIDQINMFQYFEIDVLLGYLMKLMMVERWIQLDEQRGSEVFNKITEVAMQEIS
ncbi:MAG: DUF2764 family protein [PVC group bacterium]|nr:DUF2764 family protein [PVC group bacterium]